MSVLIVYATKYGCSEKCAQLLSQNIVGEVKLLNVNKDSTVDLSKYDKVIIGGPIYIGIMQSKIKQFCSENINILKTKKLAFFMCSMFSGEKAEVNMKNAFPEELQSIAVSTKQFGGELNIDKMNFMDKFVTKMVTKATIKSGEIINNGIIPENIEKLANDINNC